MAFETNLADLLPTTDAPTSPNSSPLSLAQARTPSHPQSPIGPDLSKAPKWADVEAKPEYAKFTPEKQAEAKAAYFDYWIAPHAGDQASALRTQFLTSKQPETIQPASKPASNANGLSDVGNLFGMGVNSMAQDVRELVGRIPGVGKTVVEKLDAIDKWATGKTSDDILKGNIKSAQESLTPEMQAAGDKKWWDSDKKTFGEAWTDPRSYVSGVVQSLPEQALTMIPAMRLAKGLYATKIAAGVAPQVASAAAARAATLAGGLSEGALGGAQSSRQVRDKINAMTPDQLQGSEAMQALLAQGMSFDQAREQLANDSATQAFVIAGVTTAAFGGMGDRMLAKTITEGVGKNVVGRIVKGAAAEGVIEEFPQSYTQAVSENIAMRRADPSIGITDDALNQGLGGLALGSVQGGGMATMGHNKPAAPVTGKAAPDGRPTEPAAPSAPTIDNVTHDGRIDPFSGGYNQERDVPLVSAVQEPQATGTTASTAPTTATPTPTATTMDNVTHDGRIDPFSGGYNQERDVPLVSAIQQAQANEASAAQAQAQAQATPVAQPADSTDTVADQDVLDFAELRERQLLAKRDGEVKAVMTDNGIDHQDVPGEGLTERDVKELAALEANRGNLNALRAAYGFDQQPSPNAPTPATVDLSARTDDDLRQQLRDAASPDVQRAINAELQRRTEQTASEPVPETAQTQTAPIQQAAPATPRTEKEMAAVRSKAQFDQAMPPIASTNDAVRFDRNSASGDEATSVSRGNGYTAIHEAQVPSETTAQAGYVGSINQDKPGTGVSGGRVLSVQGEPSDGRNHGISDTDQRRAGTTVEAGSAGVKAKPTESDIRNIRALNDSVARYLRSKGRPIGNDVLGLVAGDVPGDAALREVARAFGAKTQWFVLRPGLSDVDRKTWGFFNGANIGGVNYLAARGESRPHLAILGHELVHQLKRDSPELYADFEDAVRPFIKLPEYRSDFLTSDVAKNVETAERQHEEFMAEIGSDAFMRPDFWEALGQKSPSLLKKVADLVTKLIREVLAKVGHTPKTAKYLSDFEQVMEIATDVLAKYATVQSRKVASGEIKFLFAGERSETADTQGLAEAKRLVESGQSVEQVRQSTGWFKGVDGKWRCEIDDSAARLKAPFQATGKRWGDVHKGTVTLAALIDHPTLFKSYPAFKKISVGVQAGAGASFNTKTGQIKVGQDVPMGSVLSKVLHELQHAIQTHEGFARGWNMDEAITPAMRSKVLENIAAEGGDPAEAAPFVDGQTGRALGYQWSAGEVEARNVQQRQGMTQSQRLEEAPSKTADVPEKSQIVSTDGPTLMSASPRAQREAIAKEFGDATFTKFNWLHKSVGTQYHKAQISPEFRRVFDNANAMEAAGTLVAVRTAERAPGVLPKALNLVSAAKQLVLGRKAAKEMHAATNAILEGTTQGKTVLEGRVFTDAELRSRFNLSAQGVALYRQMRSSIDAAVYEVAAAESYAMGVMYVAPAQRQTLRNLFVDNPAAGVKALNDRLDDMIRLSMRVVAAKKASADPLLSSYEGTLKDQQDTKHRIAEVIGFAKTLADVGYAPLMRFGRYTVTVQEQDPATGTLARDAEGKPLPPLYFERFETEAEAKDAYFAQGGRYAGMGDSIRISADTVNDDAYKLYAGVSPEVVSLFAEKVGSKVVEQMLTKLAVSDQSILKRQLNRKNIPGYSREYDRVLAKFVTSSGRWAASKYYMSDLKKSVKNIHQRDVQSQAQKLLEYVTDNKVDSSEDVAAGVSSLAFTWFLGGPTNIASAFVNFLQVGTLLPQHLVKSTSTAKAMAAIAKAYRTAVHPKELPADLRTALKKAEQEGKVDAQEVQHLYNIGIQGVQAFVTDYISRIPGGDVASKKLVAARYRLQAAGVLWGAMFGAVESLNRRVTFIAAWNVAKDEGIKDPFDYAIKAVDETQGIYTKANRQNIARKPLGRMVMTFKMVPAMWVEIMVRNIKYGGKEGRYAAALQLATMILLAGIAGVPFEDDLIDIIDSIAQAMGYNWNTKQAREKWAKETFGQLWGEAVVSGVSAFMPVDMGARLGVANLIPATGLFKKSNVGRREREVAELFGVGGSLAMQGMDAFDQANAGRIDRAALALAPASVRNLAQGIEMMATGTARDQLTSKKKADATVTEGAYKAVGFNPQSLAQPGQARYYETQNTTLAKITTDEIVNKWAEGLATNNQKLIDKAQAEMNDWNKKNPNYPIYLTSDQLRSKVRTYLLDADTRMLKGTPKRWRGTVYENLGLGDARGD